jgi:hypothetical protein
MRVKSKAKTILLITTAVLWLIFSITFNVNIVILNLGELGDFGSFIASGQALQQGINPYSDSSPLIFEALFPRFNVGGKMPNLNPPISLLVFGPLANVNFLQAVNLWRAISLLLYMVTVLLLANEYKASPLRILWAFALAGFWHTIGLGQIYTPLALLASLAWITSRKGREAWTGIFIGLLVGFKPNFILWILLLIIQRRWKTVLSASVTIAICLVLPLLKMPPQVYLQWLDASRVDGRVLSMPGNSSFMGLTSRIGFPQAGVLLAIILLALVAFLIFRAPPKLLHQEWVDAAGILLSLLASPITWVGYTILALPFFFSEKMWNVPILVAAAILTVPFNFTMYLYYSFGKFNFVFWGWWYGIALGICLGLTMIAIWRVRNPQNTIAQA